VDALDVAKLSNPSGVLHRLHALELCTLVPGAEDLVEDWN